MPKRSYRLNEEDRNKLETSLEKWHEFIFVDTYGRNGKGKPGDQTIDESGCPLGRATLAKIRNGSGGVNLKSVVDLYEWLLEQQKASGIDLVLGLDVYLADDLGLDLNHEEYLYLGCHVRQILEKAVMKKCSPLLPAPPDQRSKQKRRIHPPDVVSQIKKALQTLDYEQQVDVYQAFRSEYVSAGAFLIHGLKNNGQRWLLHRLVYTYGTTIGADNKISVTLTHNEDVYIDTVWKQLSRSLKVESKAPFDLVEEVFCRWQAETVVIVIHEIDRLPSYEWSKLIEEFWLPLIQRINAWDGDDCGYQVLLFLVDYVNGCFGGELEVASTIDDGWCMEQPILVPAIQSFQERRHLLSWLDQHRTLPNLLPKPEKFKQVAHQLFQDGREGVPELTMEAIAERCEPGSWQKIERSLQSL